MVPPFEKRQNISTSFEHWVVQEPNGHLPRLGLSFATWNVAVSRPAAPNTQQRHKGSRTASRSMGTRQELALTANAHSPGLLLKEQS